MPDIKDKFSALFMDDQQGQPEADKPAQPMSSMQARWTEQTRVMAGNIQQSAMLRAEINKGLRSGADPWDLLLKATQAIGLMTGDMSTHEITRAVIENQKTN